MTGACEDIRELLVDYQEGELSGEARARVEAHLAGCPSCGEAVSLLREALARAEALPVPEPPLGFWADFGAALRRRLAKEPPPRASWWARAAGWISDSLRPAPALAAAAALGLLLAVGLVRTSRAPEGRAPVDPVIMSEDLRIGQNLEVLQQLELLEELEVLERLPLVLPAA